MEKKEENKKKNRVIVILALLVIFLCIYIYLSKNWMGEDENVEGIPLGEDNIEQIDSTENPLQTERTLEISVQKEKKVERLENNENVVIEESIDADEIEEDVEEEEMEAVPTSDVKFGKSFSQRSQIWRKYQKRQTEIQIEAGKLNDDRFSKTYLGHVEREMKKLTYNLKKEYKINAGELDYIIEEGKNGKFNDAVQSF